MQFHERAKNVTRARHNKACVAHQAQLALLKQSFTWKQPNGNLHGWYQKRKRAAQRIRTISNGQIELFEGGYRGDHRRHYFRDLRCEHVFHASLRELAQGNADEACPFCHPVYDVRRYGSVAAIQEYVHQRSDGKISFADNNRLGSRDAHYTFGCHHHRIHFEATFSNFIEAIGHKEFCPLCAFPTS